MGLGRVDVSVEGAGAGRSGGEAEDEACWCGCETIGFELLVSTWRIQHSASEVLIRNVAPLWKHDTIVGASPQRSHSARASSASPRVRNTPPPLFHNSAYAAVQKLSNWLIAWIEGRRILLMTWYMLPSDDGPV